MYQDFSPTRVSSAGTSVIRTIEAVRCLTGGPRVETLLEHSTAYYLGVSLIWSTVIVVVFGILAAVRFPGPEATWAPHERNADPTGATGRSRATARWRPRRLRPVA